MKYADVSDGKKCFNCGRDVTDDNHYEAIDEDKFMCVECYPKIVKVK